MDLGTGLALFGSAEIVGKLLGPTADYIGLGTKDWTQRRVANVARIFENATKKLGSRLDSSGSVPPKVLKEVLSEGSFSEDAVATEYFGGVLASSRTEISRDDRAATFAALVGKMSTYQIRAHYLVYRSLRDVFVGSHHTLNMNDRPKLVTCLPIGAFCKAMDFSESEMQSIVSLFEHIFFGLSRESLIENFQYGNLESIRAQYPGIPERGIFFQPTVLGAELFLRAHGHANSSASALVLPETHLVFDTAIEPIDGAARALAPPQEGA